MARVGACQKQTFPLSQRHYCQRQNKLTDMKLVQLSMSKDAPVLVNLESFASEFGKNDPEALGRVLFDHVTNN
jgi:hypothetical protein